jgi:hypothetical protein
MHHVTGAGEHREISMSRRQYGFLVGFLVAWAIGLSGWGVALAAVVVGTAGYLVVRFLEGDLDIERVTDQLRFRA